MTKIILKLSGVLLAASGLMVLLAVIMPAQARPAVLNIAEPGAPTPDFLTASAPLTTTRPGPRYGHTLTRVGDTIYLFGGLETMVQGAAGLRPMDESLNNELWEYNPAHEDEWRALVPTGNLPDARVGHAATASNGKLFVHGGQGSLTELRDQWYYEPNFKTWRHIVPDSLTPNPLVGHGATWDANGMPILYGGASLNGAYMDSRVWLYNSNTNQYSMLKEQYNDSLKRKWHYLGSFDGGKRFLVFGGVGTDGKIFGDIWIFDAQLRAWFSERPAPPRSALAKDGASRWETAIVSPTARAEMAGVTYGNRFLILGGVGENEKELGEVWEYNLATHSWRALPPLPAPRRMAAAAILDEREDQIDVLVFGGVSGGEVISNPLVYTVDIPPPVSIYLPLMMR